MRDLILEAFKNVLDREGEEQALVLLGGIRNLEAAPAGQGAAKAACRGGRGKNAGTEGLLLSLRGPLVLVRAAGSGVRADLENESGRPARSGAAENRVIR